LADVAVELLDHLDVEAAAFVGNSMGGALTIEAAVRHPARVSDAMLVCSGGVPLTMARYRMVLAPLLLTLNRALRRPAMRRTLLAHPAIRRLIASGIMNDTRTVDQRHLAAALDGMGAPGVRSAIREAQRYDGLALAAQVRCPTLILWGRRPHPPAVDGRTVARADRRCRLRRVGRHRALPDDRASAALRRARQRVVGRSSRQPPSTGR
jgi:pimeloyl-ACP methyl ester carboxylesterase